MTEDSLRNIFSLTFLLNLTDEYTHTHDDNLHSITRKADEEWIDQLKYQTWLPCHVSYLNLQLSVVMPHFCVCQVISCQSLTISIYLLPLYSAIRICTPVAFLFHISCLLQFSMYRISASSWHIFSPPFLTNCLIFHIRLLVFSSIYSPI